MTVETWNLIFAILAFAVGTVGLGYQVFRDRASGLPSLRLHVQESLDDPHWMNCILQANSPGDRSWSVAEVAVLEPVPASLDSGSNRARTIQFPDAHVNREGGIVDFRLMLLSGDRLPSMRVRLSVTLGQPGGRRKTMMIKGRLKA